MRGVRVKVISQEAFEQSRLFVERYSRHVKSGAVMRNPMAYTATKRRLKKLYKRARMTNLGL